MMQPAKKIFIIDDHPLVRSGMRQLIEGEPELSVCGEAATVKQTLRAFQDTSADLAIIDLSLPDGNGLDLVKRLLAHHPDLLILIASMHDESLYAARALKVGAKGYINKQETGNDVIDAIKQVLNGKIYISEHVTEHSSQLDLKSTGPDNTSAIEQLSNRELEIFEYIGRGLSTSKIASKLNLSIKTVETHRANIKKKLGLTSATELTRSAVQWSLEST